MDSQDDREHARSAAKLEVTLTPEAGSCVRGTVQDVSVAGLFVACAERLPVGTLCELLVEAVDDLCSPIEAVGRIAHVEADGMGIQITDLALDHYDELRRLVAGEGPEDDPADE